MTATNRGTAPATRTPGVDLYWIPLGAGARVVRLSGRLFEKLSAILHRRPPCELYHSALVAVTSDGRFTVEMTPIPDARGREDPAWSPKAPSEQDGRDGFACSATRSVDGVKA